MKQVVCLSTSPWHPFPTRKQQVMSRLSDAEILYFDPPVTYLAPLKDPAAREKIRAWRAPGERVKDNLTVFSLPPIWPLFNKFRWINRLNQKRALKPRSFGFIRPRRWTASTGSTAAAWSMTAWIGTRPTAG